MMQKDSYLEQNLILYLFNHKIGNDTIVCHT